MPEPVLDENGNPIEGTPGDGGSGASSGANNPETVPVGRFNQVYGQLKTLERQITDLKQGGQKGNLSEEQQKELQAKSYLQNLLKETLDETKRVESQAEKDTQEKFEQEVNDILASATDIKRSDFLSFLKEQGDDFSSVTAAMRGYQRQQTTAKDAAEKAKKNMDGKPDVPGSEGAAGESVSMNPPEADKNRSLWEVTQDAIASLGRKK